jgi:hypothetical protein
MTTSVKITNNGPDKVRVSIMNQQASGEFEAGTLIELKPGETTPDHSCYVYDSRQLKVEEVK